MKISILAFGVAREIIGGAATSLEWQEGGTVGELKSTLEKKYPALGSIGHYLIAVNQQCVADQVSVQLQDEVAIIPPVSGG